MSQPLQLSGDAKAAGHQAYNIATTGSSMNYGGLFQERDARMITPYRTHIKFKGYDAAYYFFAANLWCSSISDAAGFFKNEY